MPKLSDKVKKSRLALGKSITERQPLWRGPSGEGPLGGITQSMLGKFYVCRERLRLLTVEGLRSNDQFDHRSEYGHMWHVCEEHLAANGDWKSALKVYGYDLCRKYPEARKQIEHWYQVCKTQFPIYVDYWSKHPDVKNRTPLFQELVFDVPYTLPSGRVVRLRGKFDAGDLIGPKTRQLVYLQENKTKSELYDPKIAGQLQSDIQSIFYLIALSQMDVMKGKQLGGVRYNCVRRPLSGGKGSIKPHKATSKKPAETMTEFYKRLADDYLLKEPETYFKRWKVDVFPNELQKWASRILNPVLEQLCEWWDHVEDCAIRGNDPFGPTLSGRYVHWQHPHGVYNAINEGGSYEIDEYLANGSMAGLTRVDTLFTELQ